MIVPARQLRKSDLVWLAENKCRRHTMPYISHYNCYLEEMPDNSPYQEKIGFLDLECSGLKGNWDIILSYCIKELDGKITGRHITPDEIFTYRFDKALVKEIIQDMKRFHRIIVYYGRDYRFDIPFLRTRAEHWRIAFPVYRDQWVTDVYDIAKKKLCLHRTRLANVCDLLGIPSKEHKLDPKKWQQAQAGHLNSLRWIFKHNQEDVVSLEGAWKRLVKYVFAHPKSSI